MVGGDGLGDVLQQDGLAGARRGDDQAALPLADRRQQVHDARGQRLAAGFQPDLLVRIDGGEVVEIAAAELFGRLALDLFDPSQPRPPALLAAIAVAAPTPMGRSRATPPAIPDAE